MFFDLTFRQGTKYFSSFLGSKNLFFYFWFCCIMYLHTLIWNFYKNVFGLIAGFFIEYIICLANQKSWVENS